MSSGPCPVRFRQLLAVMGSRSALTLFLVPRRCCAPPSAAGLARLPNREARAIKRRGRRSPGRTGCRRMGRRPGCVYRRGKRTRVWSSPTSFSSMIEAIRSQSPRASPAPMSGYPIRFRENDALMRANTAAMAS